MEYPELHRRWGELLPAIRHVAAQAVAACPGSGSAVVLPIWRTKGVEVAQESMKSRELATRQAEALQQRYRRSV